jgi:drug/metabolite transporter (DMT)-like permease
VIYSSTVSWTALITYYRGNKLSPLQLTGIVLVSVGLLLNGIGHQLEDNSRTPEASHVFIVACFALLVGTIAHSLVVIQIDEFVKQKGTCSDLYVTNKISLQRLNLE